MKLCPNCNHENPDSTRYCESCGAMLPESAPVEPTAPETTAEPIPAPAAPPVPEVPVTPTTPAPKSSKKPLIIGGVAAVLLCVVVGLFLMTRGGKLSGSPAAQFRTLQTSQVDAIFTAMNKSTSGSQSVKPTPVELTLRAKYNGDPTIASYLDGTSLSLKVDNSAKDSALIWMGFIFKNTPIVDGTLTYEGDVMGFCVPDLADSWYTMDLAKMMENAGQNDFPDLGKLNTTPTIPTKELQKAVDAYLATLLTVVTEENTTLEKSAPFSLALNGKNYSGMVYTVTPTAQEVETMLLALADQLENDTLFRDLMDQYYGDYFEQSSLQYGTPSMDEQLQETFKEAADQLRAGAKDFGVQVEREHTTWTLCTDGKKVIRQVISGDSFSVSWEGSEDGMAFYVTASGEAVCTFELTKTSLLFTVTDGTESVNVSGTFETKGDLSSGKLDVTFGTEAFLTYTFEDLSASKKSALGVPYGRYAFGMWADGSQVDFSLSVEAAENGGTDHIISISVPELDSADFSLDDLLIILNSTDQPVQVDRPTSPQVDITDYTPEQFEELSNQFSTAATGLLFKLLAAMYS